MTYNRAIIVLDKPIFNFQHSGSEKIFFNFKKKQAINNNAINPRIGNSSKKQKKTDIETPLVKRLSRDKLLSFVNYVICFFNVQRFFFVTHVLRQVFISDKCANRNEKSTI